MMLIKQNKTMIFISQPHAISLVNECYFHEERNQRADSLFQHQMQRSGGWGCSGRRGKIVYNVSFEAREIVACCCARLSENQRCVVNRSDDTKSSRVKCQFPSPSLELRCSALVIDACAGREKPPLVTALTARIINGFFIRRRRSLDVPRDLNRSREKIERKIIFQLKNVNPNNML